MKLARAFAAVLTASMALSAAATSVTCADLRANPATANVSCLDAGTTGPALPGGAKPPQFVLFTHDDALTSQTFNLFNSIKRCGAPATFFTLEAGTKCEYAQAFYKNGDEIGLHTVHHTHLTGVPAARLGDELFGVRTFLNETCGIPLEAMVGYRAPFLETDDVVRRALYADGKIRYDSSYNAIYPSKWSTDAANRLWPYTEQNPAGPFKNATAGVSESYPGMWSVPITVMQGASGGAMFAMDPTKTAATKNIANGADYTFGTPAELLALLKLNFDEVYAGSRAPTGIFIHSDWLATPGFVDAVSEFIAYVNSHPDARFATITQLVNWLENPVPASAMPPRDLTCKTAVVDAAASSASSAAQASHGSDWVDASGGGSSTQTTESSQTYWERTWSYWLIPMIVCGPVLVVIVVIGVTAAIQGCVRRRKESAAASVAEPVPTPLPISTIPVVTIV